MSNQRILFWNEEPLALEVLGEKPHKLMSLKKAKFPVPSFFTIVGDGSGKLHLNDFIRMAYGQLEKPLIARSAHPLEGNGFSFSGRFESVNRVTRLTDSPEDVVNYVAPIERRETFPEGTDIYALDDQWYETRTFSLERAYNEIVEFANPHGDTIPSRRVKEYLEAHRVNGFNANDMNLLVMEQRAVKVFGMFLTSDQARPEEMVIHYQDRRNNKGDWISYNKRNQTLRTKVEGDLEEIFLEFGKIATKVENHFGKVQQVEVGYSDKGVEIYQARDINLANMASVPRFAHYKTFSTGLHANGMGYFHLPVLVIDALDSIHSANFSSKDEATRVAVNPYREQVRSFIEQHPEYIAIVKDGELFTGYYDEDSMAKFTRTKKEAYAELNAITQKAKVVFRGKCQNAIRHDDWDLVETGGINVWMSEKELMANKFIHNQIVGRSAEFNARNYVQVGEDGGYIPPNVTLVTSRASIRTGDYIHVLANTDGTFVWQD